MDRPEMENAPEGAGRRRRRPRPDESSPVPPRRRSGQQSARAAAGEEGASKDDRQFVTALARGVDVLRAFRIGDGPLGNQELSERTGMPRPTVSRITHTLTQIGFLTFNRRLETYELGGGALSFSLVAMAALDIRALAIPLMQELGHGNDITVALSLRDKAMMVITEVVESEALVSLRLPVGSRLPVAITAPGRAYLAALPEADRDVVLEELRPHFGADWSTVRRGIDKAIREIERQGFCSSIGEWRKDINGAGAPIVMPGGREPLALTLGGPAYMVAEKELMDDLGPRLAEAARRLSASLAPHR